MEKDTVLLNLATYNEMRDFKTAITEGKSYIKIFRLNSNTAYFYTTDEMIKEMGDANKTLENKNKDLEEFNRMTIREEEKLVKTIHDIKKMSVCEFRKWRKQ